LVLGRNMYIDTCVCVGLVKLEGRSQKRCVRFS
jgi:hypothetical protein